MPWALSQIPHNPGVRVCTCHLALTQELEEQEFKGSLRYLVSSRLAWIM